MEWEPCSLCLLCCGLESKTPLGTQLLAGKVLFLYHHRIINALGLEGLKTISFHPLARTTSQLSYLLTNLFAFDNECRGNILSIKLPREGAGQEITHWSSELGSHSKMLAVPSELLVLVAMKCLLGKEGLLHSHPCIPGAAEGDLAELQVWFSRDGGKTRRYLLIANQTHLPALGKVHDCFEM